MDVVPALPALNKMFACLLPCLVLAHVFKWYSQVVQIVGLDTLDFDGEDQCPESAELLGEGRRLVEIARRRRSEDRSLQLELNDRRDESRAIPLRMQIARLIEEGTLPQDWNASSPN
ncbi:unnamed protein product [Effrenium voratum]|uniref:Uncharacterized protein n=1 Tax=Effrenium voratum TaxID=2562239 RepID=A0AA36IJB0_9DINO|nr:unnamed protein product [Effrenium voratum]